MPARTRGAAIVTALSLSLVAAACGGGDRLSEAEYEQQLNEIGDEFSTTIQNTFSSPALQNPDTLGEAADVIRDGQQVMEDAADRMDDLSPPEDAEEAHDRLVEGLRAFAEDIGGFADSAEEGNLAEIEEFSQAVQAQSLESMQQITSAIEELRALGYDPGTTE